MEASAFKIDLTDSFHSSATAGAGRELEADPGIVTGYSLLWENFHKRMVMATSVLPDEEDEDEQEGTESLKDSGNARWIDGKEYGCLGFFTTLFSRNEAIRPRIVSEEGFRTQLEIDPMNDLRRLFWSIYVETVEATKPPPPTTATRVIRNPFEGKEDGGIAYDGAVLEATVHFFDCFFGASFYSGSVPLYRWASLLVVCADDSKFLTKFLETWKDITVPYAKDVLDRRRKDALLDPIAVWELERVATRRYKDIQGDGEGDAIPLEEVSQASKLYIDMAKQIIYSDPSERLWYSVCKSSSVGLDLFGLQAGGLLQERWLTDRTGWRETGRYFSYVSEKFAAFHKNMVEVLLTDEILDGQKSSFMESDKIYGLNASGQDQEDVVVSGTTGGGGGGGAVAIPKGTTLKLMWLPKTKDTAGAKPTTSLRKVLGSIASVLQNATKACDRMSRKETIFRNSINDVLTGNKAPWVIEEAEVKTTDVVIAINNAFRSRSSSGNRGGSIVDLMPHTPNEKQRNVGMGIGIGRGSASSNLVGAFTVEATANALKALKEMEKNVIRYNEARGRLDDLVETFDRWTKVQSPSKMEDLRRDLVDVCMIMLKSLVGSKGSGLLSDKSSPSKAERIYLNGYVDYVTIYEDPYANGGRGNKKETRLVSKDASPNEPTVTAMLNDRWHNVHASAKLEARIITDTMDDLRDLCDKVLSAETATTSAAKKRARKSTGTTTTTTTATKRGGEKAKTDLARLLEGTGGVGHLVKRSLFTMVYACAVHLQIQNFQDNLGLDDEMLEIITSSCVLQDTVDNDDSEMEVEEEEEGGGDFVEECMRDNLRYAKKCLAKLVTESFSIANKAVITLPKVNVKAAATVYDFSDCPLIREEVEKAVAENRSGYGEDVPLRDLSKLVPSSLTSSYSGVLSVPIVRTNLGELGAREVQIYKVKINGGGGKAGEKEVVVVGFKDMPYRYLFDQEAKSLGMDRFLGGISTRRGLEDAKARFIMEPDSKLTNVVNLEPATLTEMELVKLEAFLDLLWRERRKWDAYSQYLDFKRTLRRPYATKEEEAQPTHDLNPGAYLNIYGLMRPYSGFDPDIDPNHVPFVTVFSSDFSVSTATGIPANKALLLDYNSSAYSQCRWTTLVWGLFPYLNNDDDYRNWHDLLCCKGSYGPFYAEGGEDGKFVAPKGGPIYEKLFDRWRTNESLHAKVRGIRLIPAGGQHLRSDNRTGLFSITPTVQGTIKGLYTPTKSYAMAVEEFQLPEEREPVTAAAAGVRRRDKKKKVGRVASWYDTVGMFASHFVSKNEEGNDPRTRIKPALIDAVCYEYSTPSNIFKTFRKVVEVACDVSLRVLATAPFLPETISVHFPHLRSFRGTTRESLSGRVPSMEALQDHLMVGWEYKIDNYEACITNVSNMLDVFLTGFEKDTTEKKPDGSLFHDVLFRDYLVSDMMMASSDANVTLSKDVNNAKITLRTVPLFAPYFVLAESALIALSSFTTVLSETLKKALKKNHDGDGDETYSIAEDMTDKVELKDRMTFVVTLLTNLRNLKIQLIVCRNTISNNFSVKGTTATATATATAPALSKFEILLKYGSMGVYFGMLQCMVIADALNSIINIVTAVQRGLHSYRYRQFLSDKVEKAELWAASDPSDLEFENLDEAVTYLFSDSILGQGYNQTGVQFEPMESLVEPIFLPALSGGKVAEKIFKSNHLPPNLMECRTFTRMFSIAHDANVAKNSWSQYNPKELERMQRNLDDFCATCLLPVIHTQRCVYLFFSEDLKRTVFQKYETPMSEPIPMTTGIMGKPDKTPSQEWDVGMYVRVISNPIRKVLGRKALEELEITCAATLRRSLRRKAASAHQLSRIRRKAPPLAEEGAEEGYFSGEGLFYLHYVDKGHPVTSTGRKGGDGGEIQTAPSKTTTTTTTAPPARTVADAFSPKKTPVKRKKKQRVDPPPGDGPNLLTSAVSLPPPPAAATEVLDLTSQLPPTSLKARNLKLKTTLKNEGIEVRDAGAAGRGLFATRDFAKEEYVTWYDGNVISRKEAGLLGGEAIGKDQTHYRRLDDNWVINGKSITEKAEVDYKRGLAAFVNTRLRGQGNTNSKIEQVQQYRFGKHAVPYYKTKDPHTEIIWVRTKVPVAKGEEFTVYYGEKYNKELEEWLSTTTTTTTTTTPLVIDLTADSDPELVVGESVMDVENVEPSARREVWDDIYGVANKYGDTEWKETTLYEKFAVMEVPWAPYAYTPFYLGWRYSGSTVFDEEFREACFHSDRKIKNAKVRVAALSYDPWPDLRRALQQRVQDKLSDTLLLLTQGGDEGKYEVWNPKDLCPDVTRAIALGDADGTDLACHKYDHHHHHDKNPELMEVLTTVFDLQDVPSTKTVYKTVDENLRWFCSSGLRCSMERKVGADGSVYARAAFYKVYQGLHYEVCSAKIDLDVSFLGKTQMLFFQEERHPGSAISLGKRRPTPSKEGELPTWNVPSNFDDGGDAAAPWFANITNVFLRLEYEGEEDRESFRLPWFNGRNTVDYAFFCSENTTTITTTTTTTTTATEGEGGGGAAKAKANGLIFESIYEILESQKGTIKESEIVRLVDERLMTPPEISNRTKKLFLGVSNPKGKEGSEAILLSANESGAFPTKPPRPDLMTMVPLKTFLESYDVYAGKRGEAKKVDGETVRQFGNLFKVVVPSVLGFYDGSSTTSSGSGGKDAVGCRRYEDVCSEEIASIYGLGLKRNLAKVVELLSAVFARRWGRDAAVVLPEEGEIPKEWLVPKDQAAMEKMTRELGFSNLSNYLSGCDVFKLMTTQVVKSTVTPLFHFNAKHGRTTHSDPHPLLMTRGEPLSSRKESMGFYLAGKVRPKVGTTVITDYYEMRQISDCTILHGEGPSQAHFLVSRGTDFKHLAANHPFPDCELSNLRLSYGGGGDGGGNSLSRDAYERIASTDPVNREYNDLASLLAQLSFRKAAFEKEIVRRMSDSTGQSSMPRPTKESEKLQDDQGFLPAEALREAVHLLTTLYAKTFGYDIFSSPPPPPSNTNTLSNDVVLEPTPVDSTFSLFAAGSNPRSALFDIGSHITERASEVDAFQNLFSQDNSADLMNHLKSSYPDRWIRLMSMSGVDRDGRRIGPIPKGPQPPEKVPVNPKDIRDLNWHWMATKVFYAANRTRSTLNALSWDFSRWTVSFPYRVAPIYAIPPPSRDFTGSNNTMGYVPLSITIGGGGGGGGGTASKRSKELQKTKRRTWINHVVCKRILDVADREYGSGRFFATCPTKCSISWLENEESEMWRHKTLVSSRDEIYREWKIFKSTTSGSHRGAWIEISSATDGTVENYAKRLIADGTLNWATSLNASRTFEDYDFFQHRDRLPAASVVCPGLPSVFRTLSDSPDLIPLPASGPNPYGFTNVDAMCYLKSLVEVSESFSRSFDLAGDLIGMATNLPSTLFYGDVRTERRPWESGWEHLKKSLDWLWYTEIVGVSDFQNVQALENRKLRGGRATHFNERSEEKVKLASSFARLFRLIIERRYPEKKANAIKLFFHIFQRGLAVLQERTATILALYRSNKYVTGGGNDAKEGQRSARGRIVTIEVPFFVFTVFLPLVCIVFSRKATSQEDEDQFLQCLESVNRIPSETFLKGAKGSQGQAIVPKDEFTTGNRLETVAFCILKIFGTRCDVVKDYLLNSQSSSWISRRVQFALNYAQIAVIAVSNLAEGRLTELTEKPPPRYKRLGKDYLVLTRIFKLEKRPEKSEISKALREGHLNSYGLHSRRFDVFCSLWDQESDVTGEDTEVRETRKFRLFQKGGGGGGDGAGEGEGEDDDEPANPPEGYYDRNIVIYNKLQSKVSGTSFL